MDNWEIGIGVLGAITGIIWKVVKMLYKKFITDRLNEHDEKLERHAQLIIEQGQNYNKKFDETHNKIDVLGEKVSLIKADTANIQGSLKTLITLMER